MLSKTFWLVLAIGGCVDPTADSTALDATTDEPAPTEGSTGHVTVNTPHGPQRLAYVVHDGHAMFEGDIDLGPVEQLHQRGGAVNFAQLWPNSVAFFRIDPNMTGDVCNADANGLPIECADARQYLRDNLAALSATLPIKLVEDVDHTADHYINYRFGPFDQSSAGHSDSIGMAFNPPGGKQTISFRSWHDAPFEPGETNWTPAWHLEPGVGTTRHETLHALGLWHEQGRDDRDAFVEIIDFCIDPGLIGNFDKQTASLDTGPYDFNSIMHYSLNSACRFRDDEGECLASCPTMIPKVSGAVIDGVTTPRGLSIEDANTMFRLYARGLGANQQGDKYGSALAIGDFDADGYDDLAIGIPDENLGNHPNAGAVLVYKGTSEGPVAWLRLSENDLGGQALTSQAHFGASLVVLDFDADGLDDLAIGAPQASGNAGYVMLYRGSQTEGLVARHRLAQSAMGHVDNAGDRFGASLAAGPVTGLVRNDGCDGVDGDGIVNVKYNALVIGAPGDRVGGVASGAVYIVHAIVPSGCGNDQLAVSRIVPPTPTSGDEFGASVVVGHLDAGSKADVAVGAPGRSNGAGAVYTYAGRLPPEASPYVWSSMVSALQGHSYGSDGAELGRALAIGDIRGNSDNELIAGGPGGSGRVKVMQGLSAALLEVLTQANPENGDRFGAALAVGNVDRTDSTMDLVVGAPGEDSNTGAITIFRGGALHILTNLRQSELVPTAFDEPNDRFGSALAVGQLDGKGPRPSTAHAGAILADLAVGVPGEQLGSGPNEAGAVALGRGAIGTVVTDWRTLDQEFARP